MKLRSVAAEWADFYAAVSGGVAIGEVQRWEMMKWFYGGFFAALCNLRKIDHSVGEGRGVRHLNALWRECQEFYGRAKAGVVAPGESDPITTREFFAWAATTFSWAVACRDSRRGEISELTQEAGSREVAMIRFAFVQKWDGKLTGREANTAAIAEVFAECAKILGL